MFLKTIKLFFILALSSNFLNAQNIGINSTGATPNSSAMLDVDAAPGNNKGLLIPRLALVATNNASPVTAPVTSLLVYNTAAASTGSTAVYPGYYYWDGTQWVRFQMANFGSSSTSWDILGNTGTVPGTNFLGTIDNQDLVFKTNNSEKMRLSTFGVLTNDNVANVLGVDIQGTNLGSQRWSINSTGFTAAFHNQSNAAFANAMLLKTVGTASSNVILELSTGTATGVATPVMIARGDGKVGIGTGYPKERFTIEGGHMQFGVSLPVNSSGESMLFSDWGSNTDAIFFQRRNYGSDNSELNLNIGDNYFSGSANTDRFNIGASRSASGTVTAIPFSSILTVETGNVRVGVNAYNPNSTLHVGGNIESSWWDPSTVTHTMATYGKLVPGALFLRGAPVGTYSNTNGFIDFVNDAGTGYDFRMSFDRAVGPMGSLSFSDNFNGGYLTIAQGSGYVGVHASASTVFQVGASIMDGISIKGGPLSFGDLGDFIFLQNDGMEKGRISTNTTLGVGGLVFSGSNVAGGVNHMTITQAGNVGIGVPVPAFKLDVSATMRVVATTYTSDRRKKQNIKSLSLSGLDLVKKLNPVSYEWKEVLDDGMKGTQLGFIAQELEQIFPSMVITSNDEQKSKSVKYNELLPIYAKAIQEQQEQIELLKQEIELLKKAISK